MQKMYKELDFINLIRKELCKVTKKKVQVVKFNVDRVLNEVRATMVVGKPSYKKVRADHAITIQDDILTLTIYASNKKRAAIEAYFGVEQQ